MPQKKGLKTDGEKARSLRENIASTIQAFVISPAVKKNLSAKTVQNIEAGGPVSRQSIEIFAKAVNVKDWKQLLDASERLALDALEGVTAGKPPHRNSGRWQLDMIFRSWSGENLIQGDSVTAVGFIDLWLPLDGRSGSGTIHATISVHRSQPRYACTISVADEVFDAVCINSSVITFQSNTFCRHVEQGSDTGDEHRRPGINKFKWHLVWDESQNKFVGMQKNEIMKSDEADVYLYRRDN